MTPTELALVKATQHGLPLVPRPYQAVADDLGIGEEEVISLLRAMLADGRIRRIGAVPNHYALGPRVGALPFVTHCYRRPRRLPDWPYNLFAMVHGRSRDETAAKIETIRATLGRSLRGSDVLYSTRMLKKTGLRML